MNETKAQEVLFYGRCQLEAMIAENELRKQLGQPIAYTEAKFIILAEETRAAYREAMR